MNKTAAFVRKLALVTLILILLLCSASCTKTPLVNVVWLDSNGAILAEEQVPAGYDPTQYPLPEDSDHWRYTEWAVKQTPERIECTAQRVSIVLVRWCDADGTELHSEYLTEEELENASFPLPEDTTEWRYDYWFRGQITSKGLTFTAQRTRILRVVWRDENGTVFQTRYIPSNETIPKLPMPESTEAWTYEVSWDETREDNTVYLTARRKPVTSYFTSNVFRITVRNRQGAIVSYGSGFVLNEEGWFITNYHVMDSAYSAYAVFDGSNVFPEIIGCVYADETRDIYIGKLDNYEPTAENYKPIGFVDTCTTGQITYSFGYPTPAVRLQINRGSVLDPSGTILNYKPNSDMHYIISSSHAAPGSSGGVLMNADFQVLGIVTLGLSGKEDNPTFRATGVVPYSAFADLLTDLDEEDLVKLKGYR